MCRWAHRAAPARPVCRAPTQSQALFVPKSRPQGRPPIGDPAVDALHLVAGAAAALVVGVLRGRGERRWRGGTRGRGGGLRALCARRGADRGPGLRRAGRGWGTRVRGGARGGAAGTRVGAAAPGAAGRGGGAAACARARAGAAPLGHRPHHVAQRGDVGVGQAAEHAGALVNVHAIVQAVEGGAAGRGRARRGASVAVAVARGWGRPWPAAAPPQPRGRARRARPSPPHTQASPRRSTVAEGPAAPGAAPRRPMPAQPHRPSIQPSSARARGAAHSTAARTAAASMREGAIFTRRWEGPAAAGGARAGFRVGVVAAWRGPWGGSVGG
jgi:hypothetical protein